MTGNRAEYSKVLNAFNLDPRKDPFPIDAPHRVDYWADNTSVLRQLISVQIEALNFTSTRLLLFWGPIGAGKTFGLRYLQSKRILEQIHSKAGVKLAKDFLFIPAVATQPRRAGELTANVYRELVRGMIKQTIGHDMLLRDLKESARDSDLPGLSRAFNELASAVRITVSGTRSTEGIQETEGYKYLTLTKSKLGRLESINDQVMVLKSLGDTLLSKFGRIVVNIDELELLSQATATERLLFSDFMRRFHDEVDDGLTIILVFTMDTYGDVEELLQRSLLTRVAEKIEFKQVTKTQELIEYVEDCIRQRGGINPSEVIANDTLKKIASDLLSINTSLTFRDINKQIRSIMTNVAFQEKFARPLRITIDNYRKARVTVPVESLIDDLRGVE